MRFIIGGRVLDLYSLGTSVDAAFKELYSAYFGHQTLNWADFQSASMQFFSANSGSIQAHNGGKKRGLLPVTFSSLICEMDVYYNHKWTTDNPKAELNN